MKKILLIILFITGSLLSFAEEIIIYGPSSAKWIGKTFGPIFKEKTDVDINYIAIDGIVSRMTLEKKNPKPDIIVGLTALQIEFLKKIEIITKYKPKNADNIKSENFILDKEFYGTSFDYGLLAINYNKKIIENSPKTLDELGKLEKKLLVENPNLSSTGEEALLWSIALYDKNWKDFWNKIKPVIYSSEPGWSEAFAKFTTEEAPMMIGYATSNLFFTEDPSQAKFDSFLLSEGAFMYLEGVSLVNKPEIKDGAKLFMEYILTEEFQGLVSTKNYMFPVTDIVLPDSFKSIPTTDNVIKLSDNQIQDLIKNLDKYKNELVEILKK
ncbi:MAG: thiamine ABC transporter substrate-binding protein [Fusobacteriaceae bacterium]|jgi:thiamine transport system substrate-binding protein|nr:thiamine ABC transporter substrate-binding protein [Fusobacteriaceae bacterium]